MQRLAPALRCPHGSGPSPAAAAQLLPALGQISVSTPQPQQPVPVWTTSWWATKLVSIKGTEVNPSFLAQAILSTLLIGGAILTYKLVLENVYRKADEWKVCSKIPELKPLKQAVQPAGVSLLDLQQVKKNILHLGMNEKDAPLLSQRVRLITQVNQLDQAQRSACTIGIYFFANKLATDSIATAAGIITVASLAFVSKRGWDQSNNAIINIGITSGLILFSTFTFSQLYSQGNNYESQRIKQNLAINLLNRVASASSNRSVDHTDTKTGSKTMLDLDSADGIRTFIESLDADLQTLHKLDFGVDATFAQNAVLRIMPLLSQDQRLTTPVPVLPPAPKTP